MSIRDIATLAAASIALAGVLVTAQASSHREAPAITHSPKVDASDFYLFRSYEPGRDGFVTLIANYQPLQDAYGGPNYFLMDAAALYEIHVDNDGDAIEDLSFQFRFDNIFRDAALAIGPNDSDVTIPLSNVGPGPNTATFGPGVNDSGGSNVLENYRVTVVTGDRRSDSNPPAATNGGSIRDNGALPDSSDTTIFRKPADYIGSKTIPNYAEYADNHVFAITVPGCATPGRVFAGQRREGFVVNLGEVFDRVNLNPLGARDSRSNSIADKNVTTLALELPVECLGNGSEPVIGAWTTASLRQARVLNPAPGLPGREGASQQGGAWVQVSRLGSPLVNEVVIGLDRKDAFNAAEPAGDLAAFATFVTHPTLPVLVEVLFGVPAPATPRNDLVAAFVTGIRTSVNGTPTNFTQPQAITDGTGTPGEMLRLNTAFPGSTPPTISSQNDLGFLACDLFGFPNGRRPIDDVVDIALTVAEGAITADNPNQLQTCDVSGAAPTVANDGAVVNDGARPVAANYPDSFPYLAHPVAGAGNL